MASPPVWRCTTPDVLQLADELAELHGLTLLPSWYRGH
jgi:hypothetical protein